MVPGLEALIAECAPSVAPSTMMAIVHTESSGQPWALNVVSQQKLMRQPSSMEEAVHWAEWLVHRGYGVAIGLGQVYSKHLTNPRSPGYGLSIRQLYEPCTNLRVSGEILQRSYVAAKQLPNLDEQAALRAAISAYNTGNFKDGFTNGYVQTVSRNVGRLYSFKKTGGDK